MKNIIRTIVTLTIVFSQPAILNAQTLSPKVIAAGAGYATGGGTSLSWTLGETFTATLSAGSSKLSQGEQQPEIQINTGSVSASFCAGSGGTVPFTAYGIIGSSNVFTAQLSNASGNFASPVNIGTLTGNASGTVTVTIPPGTPAGNGYRIRVKSSLPVFNGRDNGINIAISTGSVAGSAGTISAPAEACNSTVSLISVPVITGQNIQYSWNTGTNSSVVLYSTSSSGPFVSGPFLTTANSVYAQFGTLAGSSGYNICVQGTNSCGSTNNKCIWIRGVVNSPGAISGAMVACPGDVKNYSAGLSGGALVYTWTLAGSQAPITSGQGSASISVTYPVSFTSGQLCVTAALSCGGSSTSAPRCITVSKNPAQPAAFTSGPSKICPGETNVLYSVPAVAGAAGYSWTVPPGAGIVETPPYSNSIHVNFPATYLNSPPVCVTATSDCGAGTARCRSVSSYLPSQPGSMSGPVANVCNAVAQYAVPADPLATGGYTWLNPAGTTIVSGQGSATILLSISSSFTGGYLSVTAKTSSCSPGTSTPRTITINGKPPTPVSITANPAVWCAGASINFSTPVPATGPLPVYSWVVTNGTITGGTGTNNIDVTWGTGTGLVKVTAGNSCGTSAVKSVSFSSSCREGDEAVGAQSILFSVFPNPAHDRITVSIDVKEPGVLTLQLLDVTGRLVLQENHIISDSGNAYDLDVKNLAKGIYTLKASGNGESYKTKIVVE